MNLEAHKPGGPNGESTSTVSDNLAALKAAKHRRDVSQPGSDKHEHWERVAKGFSWALGWTVYFLRRDYSGK